MRPFNWLGVMAGIVVAEALAFLWYGPLFGERWNILMGRDPLSVVMDPNNTEMAFAVMANALWVGGVAWLAARFGADGWFSGARIGAAAWLLFAVPMQSFAVTFEGRDRMLGMINAGYSFVAFTIAGALIGGLVLRQRGAGSAD